MRECRHEIAWHNDTSAARHLMHRDFDRPGGLRLRLGPDTTYGKSRGTSLNGTSVFAAMLRERGHEVRPAIRLDRRAGGLGGGDRAFRPYPGPPAADEAAWYRNWLAAGPERWLIYVVRDFDTVAEYWKSVRDELAESSRADRAGRSRETAGSTAADWVARLPKKPKSRGRSPRMVRRPRPRANPPEVCTKLDGPLGRRDRCRGGRA